MEQFEGARLQVVYSIYGMDKTVSQNFADVANGAEKGEVVAFAQMMASLVEEDHELAHIYHTVTTEYIPD